MRIGLVQLDAGCISSQRDDHYLDYTQKAHASGCDLLVFPELSNSGYDIRVTQSITAEQINSLQSMAKEYNLPLLVGCHYTEGHDAYNTLLYIAQSGAVICAYKKMHLFSSGTTDEETVFSAGNRLMCVDTGMYRIGLAICFDLRYPALFQKYALSGSQILITAAAWPSKRITDWKLLHQTRALENQCFSVGVNYCGKKRDIVMGGHSIVCGPDGRVIMEADESSSLLTCDLDISEVEQTRSSFPVFEKAQHEPYACDVLSAVTKDHHDGSKGGS